MAIDRHRMQAVYEASVAWVTGVGSLGAIIDAVNDDVTPGPALTAVDRETFEWLVKFIHVHTMPGVPMRTDKLRALAVLNRLLDSMDKP